MVGALLIAGVAGGCQSTAGGGSVDFETSMALERTLTIGTTSGTEGDARYAKAIYKNAIWALDGLPGPELNPKRQADLLQHVHDEATGLCGSEDYLLQDKPEFEMYEYVKKLHHGSALSQSGASNALLASVGYGAIPAMIVALMAEAEKEYRGPQYSGDLQFPLSVTIRFRCRSEADEESRPKKDG